MRVERLRRRRTGAGVEVGATVTWEECERPPVELAYAAEGEAADFLQPDPNAFLLAVAFPAGRHGERRIAIEGAVCPRLRDGLGAAAALIESWYGEPRTLPAIEPAEGFRAPAPSPPRAAGFLSGGADSLDLLLRNRSRLGPGHPASIRAALHVSGFPYVHAPGSDAERDLRDRAFRASSAVAAALEVPLTRIDTNLLAVESNVAFSGREYFAAAYASTAHLFSSRWTSVALASGHEIPAVLTPAGSHPLLDPLFSSGALELRHEGADRTRLEKIEAIAARPELLPCLLVCHEGPLPGPALNCGRCEKCVRTMTELAAAGAPAGAASFAEELTPVAIESAAVAPEVEFFWPPLVEPLRRRGRGDLARAVERRVRRARGVERWHSDAGWSGLLRRIDRRLLGERLLRARRLLFRSARA